MMESVCIPLGVPLRCYVSTYACRMDIVFGRLSHDNRAILANVIALMGNGMSQAIVKVA